LLGLHPITLVGHLQSASAIIVHTTLPFPGRFFNIRSPILSTPSTCFAIIEMYSVRLRRVFEKMSGERSAECSLGSGGQRRGLGNMSKVELHMAVKGSNWMVHVEKEDGTRNVMVRANHVPTFSISTSVHSQRTLPASTSLARLLPVFAWPNFPTGV
jgi:hypothetical protein